MNFDDLPEPTATTPVRFDDLPAPKPTPPPSAAGPMPGTFEAIGQGFRRGAAEAEAFPGAMRGEAPSLPPERSRAAEPLAWGDVLSGDIFPKLGYQVGASAPTIGAGVVGGLGGTAVAGPAGGIVGGAVGAAAGAALQKIAPAFQEELQKSPQDPDGAWNRAMQQAEISGAFSGLGWSLFPARFFSGPLKNLAFQTFGVQPAVGVAEQATQNIAAGKPVGENVPQAYAQSALGTAVPLAGHAVISAALPARARPAQPFTATGPKLDLTAPEKVIDPTQPTPGEAPPPSPGIKGMVERQVNRWKRTFQPEEISDLSRQASGIFREMGAMSAARRDSLINSSAEMRNIFQGLSRPEQIEFTEAMDSPGVRNLFQQMAGKPAQTQAAMLQMFNQGSQFKLDPELAGHGDYMAFVLDHIEGLDKQAGAKYGYLMDYFPRQFKNPGQAQQFIQQRIQSMGGSDSKTFQKHRVNEFFMDGLNQGLEPVSYNPVEQFTNRIVGSIDLQEKMHMLNRINQIEAATGALTPSEAQIANDSGWRLIKDPVGNQRAIHPDLSPMWDNVIAQRGFWGDPGTTGDLFRKYMGLKNFYVLPKLALSLFHPLHVAHINISEGAARGWQSIKTGDLPGAVGQFVNGLATAVPFVPKTEATFAREAWLTPEWRQTPEQKAVVRTMVEGGFSPQLSEELRTAGIRNFKDAVANQNWLGALGSGAKVAIEAMQKQVFEKWIPSLKTAAYLNEAKDLFARHPELLDDDVNRRVALGTIAKSIDNRYGEMFYKNLFWNKALKEAGIGSFLSLGWNLGFLREFGGGALEPFLKNAIEQTPTRAAVAAAKNKTAFAFIYMANAMALNSLISAYIGGKNYKDMEYMDYILPTIGGTNPDGSPRRITNMFYTREIPMAMKHIEEQQSVLGGLRSMLWNKMLLEPGYELWNNRDYYGFNIYDENSPWYQRASQLGNFILSDQFNPISITGGRRALESAGKWNPDDSVGQKLYKIITEPESQAAIAGFGPAPSYAAKSATVNRLNYLFGRYVSPTERPEAERDIVDKRRMARNALAQAQQRKDPEAIQVAAKRLADLGITTKQLKQAQPGTSDIYMFSRLPFTIQKQFLLDLGPEDFKRYFPKAQKQKVQRDPEVVALAQRYYRGYAHGGAVDGKLLKSHRTVRYQPTPNGNQQCDRCTMFRKPNGCTAVAGYISPRGWCKLFARDARRI